MCICLYTTVYTVIQWVCPFVRPVKNLNNSYKSISIQKMIISYSKCTHCSGPHLYFVCISCQFQALKFLTFQKRTNTISIWITQKWGPAEINLSAIHTTVHCKPNHQKLWSNLAVLRNLPEKNSILCLMSFVIQQKLVREVQKFGAKFFPLYFCFFLLFPAIFVDPLSVRTW